MRGRRIDEGRKMATTRKDRTRGGRKMILSPSFFRPAEREGGSLPGLGEGEGGGGGDEEAAWRKRKVR